jgi:hypothetical protein
MSRDADPDSADLIPASIRAIQIRASTHQPDNAIEQNYTL